MNRLASLRLLRILAALMLVVACRPPSVLGQGGSCLTSQASADVFLGTVRKLYSQVGADSVQWKATGFPFATGSAITLVTSTATCDSAVTAYNTAAGTTGTQYAVSQLYVARIGTMGHVATPTKGPSNERTTYIWFNNQWDFKQRMEN